MFSSKPDWARSFASGSMVTANNEIAAAEEALKNGAFAYLPKPFQLQYADHLVAAALEAPRH